MWLKIKLLAISEAWERLVHLAKKQPRVIAFNWQGELIIFKEKDRIKCSPVVTNLKFSAVLMDPSQHCCSVWNDTCRTHWGRSPHSGIPTCCQVDLWRITLPWKFLIIPGIGFKHRLGRLKLVCSATVTSYWTWNFAWSKFSFHSFISEWKPKQGLNWP